MWRDIARQSFSRKYDEWQNNTIETVKRGGDYAVEKWEQAQKDYRNGMKYADIAEKHGVSLNTVKSWKTRYWNGKKVCTQNEKSVQSKTDKLCTQKRGAPIGNGNALFNDGGAPLRNQNALKHGGYKSIYFDMLSDVEWAMIEDMPNDEEAQLIHQLELFSLRERNVLLAIKSEKSKKGGLSISGGTVTHTKREFDSEDERKQYEELRQQKIEEDKISYLGYDKTTTTITESTTNTIARLENELTRIQRAKTQCIAELHKVRLVKKELDEAIKGNEIVNDWVAAVLGGDVNEEE